MSWVIVPGAYNNFDRDQSGWCWWCLTVRWNHWLRVEVVRPSKALVSFYLVYCKISHIHAWNMVQDDWMKVRFCSSQSMVGWYMEVPELVHTIHMLICVIHYWWSMSIIIDLLLFKWLVYHGLIFGWVYATYMVYLLLCNVLLTYI